MFNIGGKLIFIEKLNKWSAFHYHNQNLNKLHKEIWRVLLHLCVIPHIVKDIKKDRTFLHYQLSKVTSKFLAAQNIELLQINL